MTAAMAEAPSYGRPLEGLKIALDARFVSIPGVGLSRYLFGIIPALRDAGAQLTLITNFDTAPYEHLFDGVEWRGFGYKTQTFWEQLSVPRFLRQRKFDIYWLPATMGTPLVPTGQTLKLTTVHDLVQLHFPVEYFVRDPLFALPFSVWVVGALFRNDEILTVSHASARDIRRFSRRRATVVAPTLGEHILEEPTADDMRDLPEGRYLVYNGGLEKRKRVPTMLEGVAKAFAAHPDLTLVLMGASMKTLEPQLRSLGIWERTFLPGFVTEGRKTALLRGATALLYTSKFEGFGIPLVEAMAARIPILTARNTSIPEVVADAAILLERITPEEIAAGIIRIVDDGEQQRLRAAAVKRHEEILPILSADALVEGVQKVLALQGRAPRPWV